MFRSWFGTCLWDADSAVDTPVGCECPFLGLVSLFDSAVTFLWFQSAQDDESLMQRVRANGSLLLLLVVNSRVGCECPFLGPVSVKFRINFFGFQSSQKRRVARAVVSV